MARVLFVMHGMGEFADGWETDVVALLNAQATAAQPITGRAIRFDETAAADVRVVPIRYDDVFTDYWARSARDAAQLTQFAKAANVTLPRPDLWEWLVQGDDDKQSFLRSHILDVVLFRFFPALRQQVRERIALRIAEAVQAVGGMANNQVIFLAHSLGTAVLQQSLEHLSTVPLTDSQTGKTVETYLYRGAPLYDAAVMCANVSRVLELEDVQSASVVAPWTRTASSGCLGSYYTFRHALDPFLWFRPFQPANWGEAFVSPPQLRHYLEPNVHGFTHYLDHPAVHLNLFNAVVGDALASDATIAALTRDFEQAHGLDAYLEKLAEERAGISPACLNELEEFPTMLQTLEHASADMSAIEDWFALGVQYGGMLLKTARTCGLTVDL